MELIATDNKQVVIGLGVTGLSCVRYLAANNKPFAVVDSRENPPGLEAFKAEFPWLTEDQAIRKPERHISGH